AAAQRFGVNLAKDWRQRLPQITQQLSWVGHWITTPLLSTDWCRKGFGTRVGALAATQNNGEHRDRRGINARSLRPTTVAKLLLQFAFQPLWPRDRPRSAGCPGGCTAGHPKPRNWRDPWLPKSYTSTINHSKTPQLSNVQGQARD